jgi:hypothetical protein
MKFDLPYPTISKSDCGNTLEFSPTAGAKLLSQASNLTNRTADRDSLDICNFAEDFKVHLSCFKDSSQGLPK